MARKNAMPGAGPSTAPTPARAAAPRGSRERWLGRGARSPQPGGRVAGAAAAGLIALVLALGGGVRLAAQAEGMGAIRGVVTDPRGAAVPGAVVTVQSAALHITRTVTAGAQGRFAVAALWPGRYTATVTARGFAPAHTRMVTVGASATLELKIILRLATARQQVTVRARGGTLEGQTVQTAENRQSPAVVTTIPGLSVTYLPNRNRQFSQFAALSPAVLWSGSGEPAIAGQQSSRSETEVDGANDNDAFNGGPRGGRDGALFFPQTVVQEFDIEPAGASAATGNTNGGVVRITTKSGSDKIHGEGMFTGQLGGALGNDPFGQPLSLGQDILAGSIGGPIVRNRLYYYAGAEHDDLRTPAWTLFQPQAAGTPLPAGLAALQRQAVGRATPTALFARIDVIATPTESLNLQADYNDVSNTAFQNNVSVRSDAAPSANGTLRGQSTWFRAELTSVLSPALVNQALASVISDRRDVTSSSPAPELLIEGFGVLGGDALTPERYVSEQRQFRDNVSLTRGGGILQAGASANWEPAREQRTPDGNGLYTFTSLAEYLSRRIYRFEQAFGSPVYDQTVRQFGAYVTGRETVGHGVALTLGLRWDGQDNPAPMPGDWSQWQPRLGLAWNPHGTTVVRLSAGLYDAPTPAAWFAPAFLNTPFADSAFDPGLLAAASGLAGLAGPPANSNWLIYGLSPAYRNPRSFADAATLGQRAGPWQLTAGYLGHSTWDLPRETDINLSAPVIQPDGLPLFASPRPHPSLGRELWLGSTARSTFNGLLASAHARLGRRTEIGATYTYSRSWANASPITPFGLDTTQNPYNLAGERGPAATDARQQASFDSLVYLPWGFKVDDVLVARSGLPYTPLVGLDLSNDQNDFNDRAVIHGAAAGWNSLRQPGAFDLDMRIVKDFTLRGEGHHLDLFVDIYNLTNAANLNFGPQAISLYGTPAAPVFSAGQALFAPGAAALGGARTIQFTARLVAF